MKILFLLITAIGFSLAVRAQHVQEILKNPAAAHAVVFDGQKNETRNFIAGAAKFTSLNEAAIAGINDSVQFEQVLLAIAAAPSVKQITISHCGIARISGAIRMLTNINEVNILACDRLEADQAFTVLSEMPGLVRLKYETQNLTAAPHSILRLRSLHEVRIINKNPALADAYYLNQLGPENLFDTQKIELGFGDDQLLIEYSCYNKTTGKRHLNAIADLLQGVPGANGSFVFSPAENKFNKQHPLVHAPVAGIDVFKSYFNVDSKKGGTLSYPSGTQILVPENAFVDANGNPVSGSVSLGYREFRDPVDIMLSGIPMDYDSAGKTGHFVSAGMFDINASVNGQEVFLAPGKEIDMKFAVTDTAASFNFYRLDE